MMVIKPPICWMSPHPSLTCFAGDEVRRDVEYVQGRRCARGEGELEGIQEEAKLRSDSCAAHVRWYCAFA
jgi:hypothetical protein